MGNKSHFPKRRKDKTYMLIILILLTIGACAYIIAKGNAEFEARWNRDLGNHDDMEDRK